MPDGISYWPIPDVRLEVPSEAVAVVTDGGGDAFETVLIVELLCSQNIDKHLQGFPMSL